VHPSQSTVVPLAPEPIVKGDGQSKNDCEQTAAKRLLARVRRAHPHLKPVVMQDALGATAPQLALCQQLDLRFLIAVKPGSHAHLFEAIGSGHRGRMVCRRQRGRTELCTAVASGARCAAQ
jgi:hypothetical protein